MVTSRFWTIALVALTVPVLLAQAAFGDKVTVAGSAEWPQWLGPHRNGRSGVTGLQRQWPDEGPRQVWRRPLGQGFSSIAVTRGSVYTMFSNDGGEYVVSLNDADGSERWRMRIDGQYSESQGGNGPRCTPAVDGDLVFAVGARGKLVALNTASGKIIWQRDLAQDFGSRSPRWGFSGSPLVEGDLLLLEVGGRDGHALAAFDKRTGGIAWTGQHDAMGYSSPTAATIAGARQVLFFTATGLVSLAPSDGRVLWRFPWETPYNVNAATPLFLPPNRVFISSAYDVGASMVEVNRSNQGLGVASVWRNRNMKNQMATSVHDRGYIYGFDNAMLTCVDAATGSRQWKARGHGKGTLVWADGLLLVLSDKGRFALVKADPSAYRELASVQVLDGLCWTAPAIANGRAYLRNTSEVVCLQLMPAGS